jgi:hypothetical protein
VFDKIIASQGTSESIWNYHVWVDAWMKREDLSQPADWNAVDATPQETSIDGEFKMGPAYVPFVRDNIHQDDDKNYDNQFVIGEVNSIHRFTYLIPPLHPKSQNQKRRSAELIKCSYHRTITSCFKKKKRNKRHTKIWLRDFEEEDVLLQRNVLQRS